MRWCGPRISEYSLSAVSQIRLAQSPFEAGKFQPGRAERRHGKKFSNRFLLFDFFLLVFFNIGNKSSTARLNTPEGGKQAAINRPL
jgi:hypothetical protein